MKIHAPFMFACRGAHANMIPSTTLSLQQTITKTAFQKTIYHFLCKYTRNLATQPIMRKIPPSSLRRFLPFHRGAMRMHNADLADNLRLPLS